MTLIGGHSAAGTPAPHGASWFSSTQFSAESAPTISSTAPVEIDTRLAPGAAPCSCAAVGQRRRPAGDDPAHVRAVAAAGERVGVDDARHGDDAVGAGVGLDQAEALEVRDDGAAAVGVAEVRVRRVDAGVDDRDRDAAAVEGLGRSRR